MQGTAQEALQNSFSALLRCCRAARAHMVKIYAPEVVAQVVVEQLRRIEALLAS